MRPVLGARSLRLPVPKAPASEFPRLRRAEAVSPCKIRLVSPSWMQISTEVDRHNRYPKCHLCRLNRESVKLSSEMFLTSGLAPDIYFSSVRRRRYNTHTSSPPRSSSRRTNAEVGKRLTTGYGRASMPDFRKRSSRTGLMRDRSGRFVSCRTFDSAVQPR